VDPILRTFPGGVAVVDLPCEETEGFPAIGARGGGKLGNPPLDLTLSTKS
jgi:hypothetical protein